MKKVIITGTSRGIGKATAMTFLEKGYEVIGSSTSGKSKIKNSHFRCIKLNLGYENSINQFINEVKDTKIDGIINVAAILLEEWDNPEINMNQLKKTFDVNVFGIIDFTEKLIPNLNKSSHIINISSNWGSFSAENFSKFQPHYKMSKATLNMYSKLLFERLSKKDIKVSVLDPGWVKTDMGTNNATRNPEEPANEIADLFEKEVKGCNFWNNGQIRDW